MKQSLGRGLDSLIPRGPQNDTKQVQASSNYLEVDLTEIIPNDNQPRRVFDQTLLEDLADSIRSKGVIQPAIVTKTAGGKYMLIEGERRWRASGLAGKKTIPVVIKSVDTEKERLELALVTNAQREDLNPMELAYAYAKLVKEYGYRQEDLSFIMGKSRSAVANRLRLLTLPSIVQEAIEGKQITEGHARAILSLEDESDMMKLLDIIIKKGLSVREAEVLSKKLPNMQNEQKVKKREGGDFYTKTLVSEIESFFKSKVNIKKKNKGGVIEIKYNSDDELDTIIKKIRGEAC